MSCEAKGVYVIHVNGASANGEYQAKAEKERRVRKPSKNHGTTHIDKSAPA